MVLRLVAQGPWPDRPTDEDLGYLDGRIIDFGSSIEVSIGLSENEQTIFRGLVSGLEVDLEEGREPHVVVFAEDELMKLRMSRHVRTFEDMSDADIAGDVAAELGLAADVAADGPTYDVVHQWNQSDLAFLRERASLINAEIWFADGTLHFQSRGHRSTPDITLVQGNHLISSQIRADLAHQRSTVAVSGYDADGRQAISEEAGVDAILAEVPGGRVGPALLDRALGERKSFLVRAAPLTTTEADEWARAAMLRRGRQFVTMTGTTRGTPNMSVGSRLTLERVGEPFEGPGYYVTRVCHSYDLSSGYRTEFGAERATVNDS